MALIQTIILDDILKSLAARYPYRYDDIKHIYDLVKSIDDIISILDKSVAMGFLIDPTKISLTTDNEQKTLKLNYPLSSAHEVWQMAREMSCSEFANYYNKLIKDLKIKLK